MCCREAKWNAPEIQNPLFLQPIQEGPKCSVVRQGHLGEVLEKLLEDLSNKLLNRFLSACVIWSDSTDFGLPLTRRFCPCPWSSRSSTSHFISISWALWWTNICWSVKVASSRWEVVCSTSVILCYSVEVFSQVCNGWRKRGFGICGKSTILGICRANSINVGKLSHRVSVLCCVPKYDLLSSCVPWRVPGILIHVIYNLFNLLEGHMNIGTDKWTFNHKRMFYFILFFELSISLFHIISCMHY